MAIKVYRPINPGIRHASVIKDSELSKARPLKSLRMVKKRMGGRNAQGKITVRHKGGGAKRFIREVDFRREKYDISARVISIEYDPNRNARIALLTYQDGEKRYILVPKTMKVGNKFIVSLLEAIDKASKSRRSDHLAID